MSVPPPDMAVLTLPCGAFHRVGNKRPMCDSARGVLWSYSVSLTFAPSPLNRFGDYWRVSFAKSHRPDKLFYSRRHRFKSRPQNRNCLKR